MADHLSTYFNLPPLDEILTTFVIVDDKLHWAGVPPTPTTEGGYIRLTPQRRLPTRLLTWICYYRAKPEYIITHRRNSDGCESRITNLIEVIPAEGPAKPIEIFYWFMGGLILARVVPRRDQRYCTKEDRTVIQKLFADFTAAERWTYDMKLGMQAYRTERKDKAKPRSGGRDYPYPTLPSTIPQTIAQTQTNLSQGELATIQDRKYYVSPPNPANLDMLSIRACQRFIGNAINLARTNDGYQLSQTGQNRRGATLTLTLGAYDGSWRCRTVTVRPDGTQIEDLRESQPMAMTGWRVSTTLHTTITPGKAPENLRKALIDQWRTSPPSQEDLRRSRASLTATPIPILNVDHRTTKSRKPHLAAVTTSTSTSTSTHTDFALPIFLDELFSPLTTPTQTQTKTQTPQALSQYTAPGNMLGVQVHVERTTAGFVVSLRAALPSPTYDPAFGQRAYKKLASGTIPAKISHARLRQYPNTKAVFSKVVSSLEHATSPGFISELARAIEVRLANEITHTPLGTPMPALILPHPKPKPQYTYSKYRNAGSPRSLLVTIYTADSLDPKAPLQEITCHLAKAIAIIQNEDLNDPNRTAPYEVVRRRIKEGGWDPRLAITTPKRNRITNQRE